MDPFVKLQWVVALHSGEFTQGVSRMRGHEGYCVLGVLSELHRREFGGEWTPKNCYLGEDARLPLEVQLWAGLDAVPRIDGKFISILNDSRVPFNQLAQAIEEQL